jgi:hypothetical protein
VRDERENSQKILKREKIVVDIIIIKKCDLSANKLEF